MLVMNALGDIRRRGAREAPPHNAEPNVNEVVPYGRYGVGLLTGHPIGLVIVLGLLLMGLLGLPEYRLFFVGSLVLGGLLGFSLWLRDR
jgi:hypothetical protein